MPLTKRLSAEFIGTLWLVLGGCGSAVIASTFQTVGIGYVGTSIAFGLTVLTMAYAIGHISGCHLNPAVTLGLWAGKRFPAKDIVPYIIAQVLGGISGAGLLYVIASGKPGFLIGSFATNGFGANSPGKYDPMSCFVAEVVMTFFFVIVILGATHGRSSKGFAPLAIGLCLTLIHLITLPVTFTSVNPARSTGPAVFVQGAALTQLWMFWVAPILGALLAGFIYYWLVGDDEVPEPSVDDAAVDVVVIEETLIEEFEGDENDKG